MTETGQAALVPRAIAILRDVQKYIAAGSDLHKWESSFLRILTNVILASCATCCK